VYVIWFVTGMRGQRVTTSTVSTVGSLHWSSACSDTSYMPPRVGRK
jgi:hypothetical protein